MSLLISPVQVKSKYSKFNPTSFNAIEILFRNLTLLLIPNLLTCGNFDKKVDGNRYVVSKILNGQLGDFVNFENVCVFSIKIFQRFAGGQSLQKQMNISGFNFEFTLFIELVLCDEWKSLLSNNTIHGNR